MSQRSPWSSAEQRNFLNDIQATNGDVQPPVAHSEQHGAHHRTNASSTSTDQQHHTNQQKQQQQQQQQQTPNLPVEISFLIRQQAQSLARINRLERKINELRNEISTNIGYPDPQYIPLSHQPYGYADQPDDLLLGHWNPLNRHTNVPLMNEDPFRRSLPVFSVKSSVGHRVPHRMFDSNAGTISLHQQASVKKLNNRMSNDPRRTIFMSDDSGGDYSRATLSDNDELSSLLDQILKISTNNTTNPTEPEHHTDRHNYNEPNDSQSGEEPFPDDKTIVDVKTHINKGTCNTLDSIEPDNWLRIRRL